MFNEMRKRRRIARDQAALREIERHAKKFSSLGVLQDSLFHIIVQHSSSDDLVKMSNLAGRIAHEKDRISTK